MVWEPVPGTWCKIQINLKIFRRGGYVVEKFCGTMVENSFKECAESGKHGGMKLSEYDYTTLITCLIGLSYYDWLWRSKLPKVLQPQLTIGLGSSEGAPFSLKI